jgi:hypothetical protein
MVTNTFLSGPIRVWFIGWSDVLGPHLSCKIVLRALCNPLTDIAKLDV